MQTINIVFSSFCDSSYLAMDPVSSGFEEWINVFCARFIQPKEGNFTGRDQCPHRANLKYVTRRSVEHGTRALTALG